ncbi:class I SAM-dependent methyltransferase [Candidatus Roizmanbacteria bacterium]|nr:class I SAM-dependent methyltransferase [Candidatus Roizmanbacteria bacterium]
MAHYTIPDLATQQEVLSLGDYDLRVTNLARFIYRKIRRNKGRLLDVGCGNGLVLRFFKRRGFDVTGMELSKDLCDVMRENPKMEEIVIIQGDISQKKGNGTYDVVLASDVIEHIDDDRKALQNLFTFVKQGGLLVVTVPAHAFLFGRRDETWGHYRRYNKKDLRDKLSDLNGKLEFVTYWNFFGFFAYYFFEKILQKPIKEDFRYEDTSVSKFTRSFLDGLLKAEELFGFSPIGLTLVAGIRKRDT